MRQECIQSATDLGGIAGMHAGTAEGSKEVSAYLMDKDRMETRVGTPKSQACQGGGLLMQWPAWHVGA